MCKYFNAALLVLEIYLTDVLVRYTKIDMYKDVYSCVIYNNKKC